MLLPDTPFELQRRARREQRYPWAMVVLTLVCVALVAVVTCVQVP